MKYVLAIFCSLLSLTAFATQYEVKCSGNSAGVSINFSALKIDSTQAHPDGYLLGNIGNSKLSVAVNDAGAAGPFDTLSLKVDEGHNTTYAISPVINGFAFLLYAKQTQREKLHIGCELKVQQP